MSEQQDAKLLDVLAAMADAITKVHLETVANVTKDLTVDERMECLDAASAALINMLNEFNAYVSGGAR